MNGIKISKMALPATDMNLHNTALIGLKGV